MKMNGICCALICPSIAIAFMLYMILLTRAPAPFGSVKSITNPFKERLSFQDAVTALVNGKRIKRLGERRGMKKVVTTIDGVSSEKYMSYWHDTPQKYDDYIRIEINDVLANDWIIED